MRGRVECGEKDERKRERLPWLDREKWRNVEVRERKRGIPSIFCLLLLPALLRLKAALRIKECGGLLLHCASWQASSFISGIPRGLRAARCNFRDYKVTRHSWVFITD